MLDAVTGRLPSSREPRLLTPAEVAQLVRTARKARRWSQEALAAEASVTHRTVQRIEAGEPSDLQTRRGVARALGLSEAWLTEPHVWLTNEELAEEHRRMREEASRTHHLLPAQRVDGRALIDLLARCEAFADGQAPELEMSRETWGAWAAFLDLVRDCLDGIEDLAMTDRLDVADNFDATLAALATNGVSVVAATRRSAWWFGAASQGITVTALYLSACRLGAEPTELAVPKE
jgi:transcriptional regulator with XRE-family HTH domain